MTSTHEACRERMVAASAVASIMTMSDGRIAADAGWGTELAAAVTTAPAATPRTERRSNSGWFDSEITDAMNSSRRTPAEQSATNISIAHWLKDNISSPGVVPQWLQTRSSVHV